MCARAVFSRNVPDLKKIFIVELPSVSSLCWYLKRRKMAEVEVKDSCSMYKSNVYCISKIEMLTPGSVISMFDLIFNSVSSGVMLTKPILCNG